MDIFVFKIAQFFSICWTIIFIYGMFFIDYVFVIGVATSSLFGLLFSGLIESD